MFKYFNSARLYTSQQTIKKTSRRTLNGTQTRINDVKYRKYTQTDDKLI